jgi:hypothetical protein
MKKLPQKFYKMNAPEQEAYLVTLLQSIYEDEAEIKRMLATVRGGYHYEAATEIDRPDLLLMKVGEGI